ncbi:hypothetical protein AJ80_01984 [Polytolypa hystricis UAMH7299]|uniref:Major facilitator superfamily (MFS) profile domain-containing protein n=1 Tax=Polytolypa hystricis (strain UAMH7299) TaxID=1447883 RepID=A0A2B7YSS7_POLH7|nr:hypothetical protein AJ80_01984 [Polytolypa hystricis UAMH7299]
MTTKEEPLTHVEDNEDANSTGPSDNGNEKAATPYAVDWDEAEEKKLVTRIDWHVFPMLCVIFGLSLLDRGNLSFAYIAGLAEDLELTTGSRYSIALLVFFIGYAVFEFPSNYAIRRIGARVWLSLLVIVWGALVLAMGFVKNWVALTVLRALLGIFEAGVFPGAIFIIGSWYRQYETARRTSLFYLAALISSGFGPIIAYGLSLIRVGDGIYRAGWRWIFIVEGMLTVVVGIAALYFLTDFPENAKWLSDREKHIAQSRIMTDQAARKYVHPTVKESLKMMVDWKMAVYAFQYFVAASGVYSMSYFKSIILKDGMGFEYVMAQLLAAPPYIFAIFPTLGMSWVSDKYRIRWPILCFQSIVALVGLIIVLYGGVPAFRYFGLFLAIYGLQANIPGTLAYGQNQTPSVEKRGIVSALMISIGAVGGIAGSTIFRGQDAPNYLPGMWTTIALQIMYTIVTFAMSMYFKRQNRLADEGKLPALEGVEGFRYAA